MKKSFKCLLLALMVLCLSATAGFATSEHALNDIKVTLKSDVDIIPADVTFFSTDINSLDKLPTAIASDESSISHDAVVVISYDSSIVPTPKFSFDIEDLNTKSFDVQSIYLASDKNGSISSTAKLTTDISITAESNDWYILVTALASDESKTANVNLNVAFAFQLNIVDHKQAPTGGAFSEATVTFKKDSTELASFDVTSKDTFTSANASFDTASDDAVSKGSYTKAAANDSVTFEISGVSSASISAVYFVNAEGTSSDVKADKKATITDGSNTFYFVFASGDKFGAVKYVFSTGGDSTGSDYGTIHFVALSGDTTVSSFDVASGDYKSGLSASNDSTVTAISKTGSFPTTATVKITIDEGTNGTAKVYDIYSGTDSVSDDYTASTGVFDPKTVAGTYKVVFVGSETAEKPYFAVSFTVTDSTAPATIEPEDVESTMGSDTEAKAPSSVTTDADGNTVTYIPANFNLPVTLKDGVWTFTSIASKYVAIAVAALEAITTDDLVTMLTSTADSRFAPDSNGEYKYVGAKLKKKVYPGTIFIIRLVLNSTGGSVNAAAATTIDGAMTVEGDDANTATDTLAIDTTDLRSTSNGDTVVDVPAGDYDITYSSLNGEVVGGLDETVSLAGNGETTVTGSNKGSSSGCDAGFGALALLALALPLVKKIKK